MDNVTPQLLLGHLIVVVRIFLGEINKEHWEFMPRVYAPSRVTPCMKIILVAHLKQADAYIWQQRYRKMLKTDDHLNDNDKGNNSHCMGESSGKSPLYFYQENYLDRKYKIIERKTLLLMHLKN